MDKTLKEKLGIVEIADVEALFDALTPWEKLEFINNHTDLEVNSGNSDIREGDYSMEDVIESASEAVDVFGDEELDAVTDFIRSQQKVVYDPNFTDLTDHSNDEKSRF